MRFKQFREEMKNISTKYAFITTTAVKDEHTPFNHPEYDATHPMLDSYEIKDKCWADDYVILNPHQCPIDWSSGANWSNLFNRGYLECLLIIKYEELVKLSSEQQAKDLEEYIDKKVIEYLKSRKAKN